MSVVHALPSSQFRAGPPLQVPVLQVSAVVHGLASSQAARLLVCVQPSLTSHASLVHGLPSSQLGATPPLHRPPLHESPVVHALASSHSAVLLLTKQPVWLLQLSVVQGFLSSQTVGSPGWQLPPWHASPLVQALLSVHATVLLVWVQPPTKVQPSSVHRLPSSQFGPPAPLHRPPPQMSPVVHALASSQTAVLFACAQPLLGAQLSSVQAFLSSQLVAGPPEQRPPLQVSPLVHALPSSQAALLLLCIQPVLASQASSVHAFASSQLTAGPPWQTPPWQLSALVHGLPSLQLPAPAECLQPEAASQLSTVHGFASSQLSAPLPTHLPPLQASLVVHGLPSSQGRALLACAQPAFAEQESSVHGLLSLQSAAPDPTQAPPTHLSTVVHRLLSVQGAAVAVWPQPSLASQASAVHGLASSQFVAAPGKQAADLQASPTVQTLPSSQTARLLPCTQPNFGSQLSSVQTFASSQDSAGPPLHAPAVQISAVVQALPSEHAAALALWSHPVFGAQLSAVQGLLSSHVVAVPAMHTAALQASPRVQALPSSQTAALARWLQPSLASQLSSVHGLLSSQPRLPGPLQLPPLQMSPVVQALLSLQIEVLLTWVHPLTGSQPSSVHGFASSQLVAPPDAQFWPWH